MAMFWTATTATTDTTDPLDALEAHVEAVSRSAYWRKARRRMFWVALLVFGFAFIASLARGQEAPRRMFSSSELQAAKAQEAGESVLIEAAQRAAEIEAAGILAKAQAQAEADKLDAKIMLLEAEARLKEAEAKLRAAQSMQRTVQYDETNSVVATEGDNGSSEVRKASFSGTAQGAKHQEKMADIDRKKVVGIAKATNPTCGFWNCSQGVPVGSTSSYYSGNTAIQYNPQGYTQGGSGSVQTTGCGQGGCNTGWNTGPAPTRREWVQGSWKYFR